MRICDGLATIDRRQNVGVYELLPKWKPLLKVHLLDEIGIQPLPVLPAWLQQFQH